MTPAGTSNELDVQNEWEENTHTHTHTPIGDFIICYQDTCIQHVCIYEHRMISIGRLIVVEIEITYDLKQGQIGPSRCSYLQKVRDTVIHLKVDEEIGKQVEDHMRR